MRSLSRRLRRIGLAAIFLWTACGDAGEEVEAGGEGGAAVEGLSRDQIQTQARPLSPDEAEALGIVDSITHLENPAPVDTLLPRIDTVPRPEPRP
jgi:hypothetical protein